MGRFLVPALMSLAGAILGATVGVAAFSWLLGQGYYAMVLPGACMGLGCHLASPARSARRGLIAGVAGLALGVVVEWWYAPMIADPGFLYFVKHIPKLRPATFLMIGLGGLFAYWWGRESSPWIGRKPARSADL